VQRSDDPNISGVLPASPRPTRAVGMRRFSTRRVCHGRAALSSAARSGASSVEIQRHASRYRPAAVTFGPICACKPAFASLRQHPPTVGAVSRLLCWCAACCRRGHKRRRRTRLRRLIRPAQLVPSQQASTPPGRSPATVAARLAHSSMAVDLRGFRDSGGRFEAGDLRRARKSARDRSSGRLAR